MVDIRSAEESYLHGKATFGKWLLEWQINWIRPALKTQIAMAQKAMPDTLREMAPRESQRLDQIAYDLTGGG